MEEQLQRLIEVLDGDVENIQRQHEMLSRIREALAERDVSAVLDLLDKARLLNERRRNLDKEREDLRTTLAERLDVETRALTLRRLETLVDGPLAAKLAEQRVRITVAVEALRKLHLGTMVAVAGAARVNRALLSALLPGVDGGVYTRDGSQSASGTHRTINLGV